MMQLFLFGRPITKKNSSQVIRNHGNTGKPLVLPSRRFRQYEEDCLKQITGRYKQKIDKKCNIKCLYYMPTRHRVDLTNLLNGTLDILVDAKVLKDDNYKIVASLDGSRVLYDKENPRVEIYIEAYDE